jgi:hypothetical protein
MKTYLSGYKLKIDKKEFVENRFNILLKKINFSYKKKSISYFRLLKTLLNYKVNYK